MENNMVDLTQEWCPNPHCDSKGTWIYAEQDVETCALQCASCRCHIILYKYDDGSIIATVEESHGVETDARIANGHANITRAKAAM